LTETIELHPVRTRWLEQIAAGTPPASVGIVVVDGALPPPHVAQRSLDHLARGCAALWCVPFNIVTIVERRIVGGCGFKGPPDAGVVEIGYGVAPSCWRRGYALAGVSGLLELANESAEISQVIAHIAPDNQASSALARRLNFSADAGLIEEDGELLVRWRRSI
jgi:[ribosomal protein S5]-alanine N-acetyltransferase